MLRLRTASIPELTAYMGRSPKSLYYHVRQLCQVGLLVVRETRQAGKRSEAVYGLVADRMIMEDENEDAEYMQTAYRAQRALLRKLARELMPAEDAQGTEGADEADVLRVLVWLTPEARTRLMAMLEEITRFLRENDDPQQGKRTALTVFVTTQKGPGRSKT
jgi:hypothetical protein